MTEVIIMFNLLALLGVLLAMILIHRWYAKKHLGAPKNYQRPVGVALETLHLDDKTREYLSEEARKDREIYRTEESI